MVRLDTPVGDDDIGPRWITSFAMGVFEAYDLTGETTWSLVVNGGRRGDDDVSIGCCNSRR